MPDELILEKRREKDKTLYPEIAETLNISFSELIGKPEDIKRLLLHTYINGSDPQIIKKQMLSIINPNYELQQDLRMDNIKNNPLKNVEELVEGNYNMIDGIINNEPPKKDQELNIYREQIKTNAERVSQKSIKQNDRSQDSISK